MPITVVAIDMIVIEGMRQVGYSKDFVVWLIANMEISGILVPPSIVTVIYTSAKDVSVWRIFFARVIRRLLAGTMLMATIYVIAKIQSLPEAKWPGWQEVFVYRSDIIWKLFPIVLILGCIYGGIFTLTGVAVVAAVYAFLVATFV